MEMFLTIKRSYLAPSNYLNFLKLERSETFGIYLYSFIGQCESRIQESEPWFKLLKLFLIYIHVLSSVCLCV